jgi:hypothetical protein
MVGRPASLLAAALSLLLAAGCGTIRLEVPKGREVRLLEEDEPADVRVQRAVWFWLWGGRPISNNSTVPEVLEHDLVEMRMRTEQTLTDNLTILFTVWFSIVRRTLIVEGNRVAARSPEPATVR